MRWREPENGTERIRSRWLLLPLRIGVETRWLERATWAEAWCGRGYGWRRIRWVY